MVGTEGSLPGSLPVASHECLSAAAVGAGVAAAAVPGLLLLLLIGGVLLALPLGLFMWSKKRCLEQQQANGVEGVMSGEGGERDGLRLAAEAEPSSAGLEGREARQEEEATQGQGGCCGGGGGSCACAEEKGRCRWTGRSWGHTGACAGMVGVMGL